MKICIVSDSHDHRAPLAAAVAEAKALGAQAVIHCGDLVAPSTLHAVIPLGLPIHLVHGNNQGDLYHLSKLAHKPENRALLRAGRGIHAAWTAHYRALSALRQGHGVDRRL